MAEFKIPTTPEEHEAVAAAITELNEIQHLRYMTQAMIAESSGIKRTKIRAILQDMIDDGEVTQYRANETNVKPRYFYVLTDAGKALLRH